MYGRLAREAYPGCPMERYREQREPWSVHCTWEKRPWALFDLMLHKVTEMDLSRGSSGSAASTACYAEGGPVQRCPAVAVRNRLAR